MKVRIGVGLGTGHDVADPGAFAAFATGLEDLGFDSLWLSEQLAGAAPDPLVALAVAAGHTERLKLGTSVLVLPGRNPVVLAKEIATLDRLSGGRFLPAVGLGAPRPAEHRAFGVRREDRGGLFDESLGLLRRLWTTDDVHHDGAHFHVEGVTIRPRPVQDPLEVWLGGRAPSELRRAGRLGDGWLPSFCTPAGAAEGWHVVTASAVAAGRTVDAEHFGALVAWSDTSLADPLVAALAERLPGVDPAEVVPIGLDALRARIQEFCAVGASKFVVVQLPTGTGPGVGHGDTGLADLAAALVGLQT